MDEGLLQVLPARRGHFLLESGYHTDLWLTLDALFVNPRAIAPLVSALAEKLRPHAVAGICGPLLGGAFLAQALAMHLAVDFYYTQPAPPPSGGGLFTAQYTLPAELGARVQGARIAVVDDVISAGSSVRATMAAMKEARASVVVVASLLVLGDTGAEHFRREGTALETLERRPFNLWAPADCSLCRAGVALEDVIHSPAGTSRA